MGYLGLLFSDINKEIQYVIFVKHKKINENIIIGFTNLKENNCHFFYIDKYYDLNNCNIAQNFKYKFAKIQTAQKTFIDYEFLTFWFEPKRYRDIRELLLIENQQDVKLYVQNNTKRLLKFFN